MARPSVVDRLRDRLGREGLRIVLPVSGDRFREVLPETGRGELDAEIGFARGAVLIADGGGEFFARFAGDRAGAPGAGPDPLDHYTRRLVEAAVAEILGPPGEASHYRVLFPFAGAGARVPFQRLGQVAGLPPPGPLGIQVHPLFGPWWAYRGLVLVAADLTEESPLVDSCPGCAAPCVTACPGSAVAREGFVIPACVDHRRAAAECHLSCRARRACPVGEGWRYPDDQVAFHMRASLTTIRARRG